jgi:hypothetical protein
LGKVNGPRFVADSELATKIQARLKLSVRPDALPCPKIWGMVTAPARAVENDPAQRRSGTKVQTEIYQSALTLGV